MSRHRNRLPMVRDYVRRQRLFHILDSQFHKGKFLITGQAAQGKSTLVASYLEDMGLPVLWFTLGEDDNDHTRLFDRIENGIQEFAGNDAETQGMVAQLPGATLGTDQGLSRHIELLSGVFHGLVSPVVIVLDDFETIDENSSGFRLVQALFSIRFEYLKLFVLSRTRPCFNVQRLKMEHGICVLDNNDLLFTLEETRQFFRDRPEEHRIDIEKIHRITNGWAGGLALVMESARQFRLMENLPARLSWDAFDFFSREIYLNLPEHIRNFLVQTAVLDAIDIEIVNHIFNFCNAAEILNDLEQRNLFIQRIDAGPNGAPCYKYHTLFKDFLVQELAAEKGMQACCAIYEKAADFFWDKKDHEQAMDYYLRAGAFSQVVKIIRIKGTDYIIRGRLSLLDKWTAKIPGAMIEKDPWLLLFRTMTKRIIGGIKNIGAFKKCLELFDMAGDVRGALIACGCLIEASVFVRQPSAVILKWIKKAGQLLAQVSQTHRYAWARALLWQHIGFGYIAGNGDIPKGMSACRSAVLLARRINNTDLVLNASIILTFGCVQAGDFVNAGQMLKKISKMTKEGIHPEYRALKTIVDIDFAFKNARFELAGRLLDRSEADIEKFGLIFLYPGFIEAKALYLAYTEKFDAARQMAGYLNDFCVLEGNDFYKGISHRITALTFFLQKRFEKAENEINLALKELDLAKKGDIHHFTALHLAGMIQMGAGKPEQAKKTLLSALSYFEGIRSEFNCVQIRMALGLMSFKTGQRQKGLEYFKHAVATACREGYVFFPMICEDDAAFVFVALAGHAMMNRFESCVVSMICRFDPDIVLEQMSFVSDGKKKKEKTGILENLRPVYKKFLPELYIETLGRFRLVLGGRVLDASAFEGSKPVLLLKSIVLHGTVDIPKEILMDDLWPDASENSGEKNFKINFHRLRKAIEPAPEKGFGYSYVIQKAGRISLDPELVTIDADRFLHLGAKAAEAEKKDRLEQALELYGKAAELYKGDYFAEEPYQEWIVRKRELLRTRYRQIMHSKAMIHEELDQIGEAVETWHAVLESDPYFEPAYRNLMIIYMDSGRKNMALEIFEECRRIFETGLGTQPDSRTMNLYNNIKSR